MAKRSQLYNLYAERIARCQDPDQLVDLAREISTLDLKDTEKSALCISCVFASKYFDRQAKKAARGNKHENSQMDCPDQS